MAGAILRCLRLCEFEVFATQEQHVSPMGVKYGKESTKGAGVRTRLLSNSHVNYRHLPDT